MRKVTITYASGVRKGKANRNKRSYVQPLSCVKCGRLLFIGGIAYRTTAKYYCKACGERVQID